MIWSAVLLSLLALTTQFVLEVGAIKSTSLKLRTNGKANPRLTKKDYISTTFRTNNETVFGFYVDVLVGTPPQFFSLQLSTSSTTWLPAPNVTVQKFCTNNTAGSEFWSCFYDNFFAPNKSSTFEKQAGVLDNYYGEGIFAQGTWGSDVFKINQLTVSNISFGLASNWSTAAELGIGVEYVRTLSPYPSLPEAMAEEGAINSVLYSIYINDIRNDGGEIFFGAVDDSKYNGSLITFDSNVVGQVPVNGINYIAPDGTNTSLSDQSLIVSNDIGEIQLGTPSLWLPNDAYRSLINNIPTLSYSSTYEMYTQDCDADDSELGTIEFNIGGMIIPVNIRQILVEYPAGSGLCLFTVYQQDKSKASDPEYLLGTPFLRSAFSVFDWTNNQTSIAPSIANSTSSTVKEVPVEGIFALPQQSMTPTTTTSSSSSPPTEMPTQPTSAAPTAKPTSEKESVNIGAIVGGSVGGVVALAIGAFLTYFIMKKRRNQGGGEDPMPIPPERINPNQLYDPNQPYNPNYYKPAPMTQTQPYHIPPPPPPPQAPSSYQENWTEPNRMSVASGSTYTATADLSSFSINGNPGMQTHGYAEMPANRNNY